MLDVVPFGPLDYWESVLSGLTAYGDGENHVLPAVGVLGVEVLDGAPVEEHHRLQFLHVELGVIVPYAQL